MRTFTVSVGFRLLIVALAAAIVAACSQNSNTTPVVQPGGAVSGVETSTTSAVGLPAITSSGSTFSGTLAAASAAVLLSEQLSGSLPSGVPALADARTAQSKPLATATPTPNAILYVTLSVPTTITVAAGSSVSFILQQLTAGVTYYLAANDGSGWSTPAAGPASISGNTLTFSNLPSFTITAGTPTTLALYGVTTSASASPTPSPTATPTAVAAPASVLFDVNNPAPATVGVTEAGNVATTFSGALACTASPPPSPAPSASPYVASLTSSATPSPTFSAGVTSASFTLQPGAETGSCSFTVTDGYNASITVPVTTAGTQLNVYGSKRK